MPPLVVAILLVVLVLALLGALPGSPLFQHQYGYGPSSALTIILVVLVILWLTGRL
jgi:hypothetical protein